MVGLMKGTGRLPRGSAGKGYWLSNHWQAGSLQTLYLLQQTLCVAAHSQSAG